MRRLTRFPLLLIALASPALVVAACGPEAAPAPVAPINVDLPSAAASSSSLAVASATPSPSPSPSASTDPSDARQAAIEEAERSGMIPPNEPDGGAMFGAALGSFGSAGTRAGPGSAQGTLRQGVTQVKGPLPPEVIQRIVRQNFGRFRLCYEKGLLSNATLEGKVVVRFVIDRGGAVSSAKDSASDLPDKAVVSCVVRGFANLSFPQPQSGEVTVTYPILFTPGTPTPASSAPSAPAKPPASPPRK